MSAGLLEELFALQAGLNDKIFQKRNLTGRDGQALSMEKLLEQARSGQALDANSDVCVWLGKFLKAHDDEARELAEELPWKWWSKDNIDLQAIRVEIVDMLHFWISLALTSGMDAQDVARIYQQKHAINEKRQDQDYSAAEKTGRDDLEIR
jgi:dimeric dUTPase (all-alpha-NTP-PPase superfamily)